MRRALLAVAVFLAALVPAAASAGPDVKRVEIAVATWVVPTTERNHYDWYAVLVWRDEHVVAQKVTSTAFAAYGECLLTHPPEVRWRLKCESTSGVVTDKDVLRADPLLEEATAHIKGNGETHTVHWSATDDRPGTFSAGEICPEGQGEGGGFARATTARGRVFGTKLAKESRFDWSLLASGAMASQCGRELMRMFDSGLTLKSD